MTPAADYDRPDAPAGPAWTDEDRTVLGRVDAARAAGAALLRWWRRVHAAAAYAERVELIRTFNQPDVGFAFFDQADLPGGAVPVMGLVEDLLYDQPKHAPPGAVRDEFREFVLHYFMRVSAFERPEAYAEVDAPPPPRPFAGLSWCPTYEANKTGFGFSQHYYKLKGSGRVGKFPADERFRIVDLRRIGTEFEWVVLKVRIYDFNLTLRARGQESARVVVPLREESYLVVSPEFVFADDRPGPGLLGRYGLGYAFIPYPDTALLAYGPGQFRASFQLIHFRVLDSGQIHLDLVFAANRPEQVARVPFAPFDWGLRLTNLFSLGLAGPFLAPLRWAANRWPLRLGTFDPVGGFVSLANAATGGAAARDYCISWEQLERQFLVQHFMQHYQMALGSLLTWRQHADWRDRAALPDEVIRGEAT
ncbi:MAG TPA: hypothetical protein VGF55_23950 [Gemmataceae bacterium]|jgi:hypothetical protein